MKKQKVFVALLGAMVLASSVSAYAERGAMRESGFATSAEIARLDSRMQKACQVELGGIMAKTAEFKQQIENAIEVDYEKRIKGFKNRLGQSLQSCMDQLKSVTGGMSLEVPTLSSILDQVEQKITDTLDQACRSAVDKVNGKVGEMLGKANLDFSKQLEFGGINVGTVGFGAGVKQK